jgi:hypothetical protein
MDPAKILRDSYELRDAYHRHPHSNTPSERFGAGFPFRIGDRTRSNNAHEGFKDYDARDHPEPFDQFPRKGDKLTRSIAFERRIGAVAIDGRSDNEDAKSKD